jgi:Restriction endonuclease PvuII
MLWARRATKYEIKTVNIDLRTDFSAHEHLKHVVISKYSKVSWLFAIYRKNRLLATYRIGL